MFKVREFFKCIYSELDDCEVYEVDNHYKTVLNDLLVDYENNIIIHRKTGTFADIQTIKHFLDSGIGDYVLNFQYDTASKKTFVVVYQPF